MESITIPFTVIVRLGAVCEKREKENKQKKAMTKDFEFIIVDNLRKNNFSYLFSFVIFNFLPELPERLNSISKCYSDFFIPD